MKQMKTVRIKTAPQSPAPKLRDTAIKAALTAGASLDTHYGKKLDEREKGRSGLVTNADVEAEEKSLKIVFEEVPGLRVIDEESPAKTDANPKVGGSSIRSTARRISFIAFRCSASRSRPNGKAKSSSGVIYHPILKETLRRSPRQRHTTQRKTHHAFRKTKKISDALLTTGFTYQKQRASSSRNGRVRTTQRRRSRGSPSRKCALSISLIPGVEFLTVSGSAIFRLGTWRQDR